MFYQGRAEIRKGSSTKIHRDNKKKDKEMTLLEQLLLYLCCFGGVIALTALSLYVLVWVIGLYL